MSFLELISISKTYPNASKPCVSGLDLTVDKGEIVAILGPSGCGKTTVLKMIAGLERQDRGSIILDGQVLDDVRTEKRSTAMVFQKPLLFKHMTVEENINFAPRVKSQTRRCDMDVRTSELIRLVHLEGFENRKADQLSGGQEQRVSLARALMTNPKVLLLDEPLSALDAKLRVEMRKSIRDICKRSGVTTIFVTHDQQEAVAVADRIALMDGGRILQYDVPEVFYHRPVSYEAAMFFGWKNAIPAHQSGTHFKCGLGEFDLDTVEPADRDVMLMIHPQAAMCTPRGAFAGLVLDATYLGTISDYRVDCNGLILNIQVSCRNMHLVGEMINFNIDSSMVWPVKPPVGGEPADTEEGGQSNGSMFDRLRDFTKGWIWRR